jgi:ornithine cyclodeaminase/alanine dehydrogenase-like protein (mu-crystallin family)
MVSVEFHENQSRNASCAMTNRRSEQILFLSRQEVESLLTMREVFDAVENVFKIIARGKDVQSEKAAIEYSHGTARLTASLGYIDGRVAGTKWHGMSQSNAAAGLPRLTALIVVNDPQTTSPIAVMDGTSITALRTGALAAIGAKYLAQDDSRTIAIIGCGIQGRSHLAAIKELFSIEDVRAYDASPKSAMAFANEMKAKLQIAIEVKDDPKSAVENAEIIAMTTSAQAPVVLENWISKGAYVAATSLFKDLDPTLSRKADKWVVGHMKADKRIISDMKRLLAIELSESDIYADLTEIISGHKPARERREERIVFTHIGMGALDLAVASIAFNKAVHKNVGTHLNL